MSELVASEIDYINAERIKSDAALLAGGALLRNGQLVITDAQWFEVYTSHDYQLSDEGQVASQELVSVQPSGAVAPNISSNTTKSLTLKPTHIPKAEDITEVAVEKFDRIERFRDEVKAVILPYTMLFDELKPPRKTVQKGFWRKRQVEYQPNYKNTWDFTQVDDQEDGTINMKDYSVALDINYCEDANNMPVVNVAGIRSEYGFYTYLKYSNGQIGEVIFESPLYSLDLIRKDAAVKETRHERAVLRNIGTNRSGVPYGIYDFASNWEHMAFHYRGFKITLGISDKAPTIIIDDAYNAQTREYVDQSKTYTYDPESDTLLLTNGSKGPKQITKEQYLGVLADVLATIPAQAA